MEPLKFAAITTNLNYSTFIVSSFKKEFLQMAYTDAIANFILPSLRLNNCKIPMSALLQVDDSTASNPWLFHSILVLADGHPGKQLPIWCFIRF